MKNAFMIAATGSGCGKTTITCGLLKAILNKGLTPKSYKCGPDYIDPMFHKAVLGIEAQNLDLFFSDQEEINEIFYGDFTNDVSLVEGVMGLYDGISSSSDEGSSYDLACKLDIPVILVVNAHGMGRSLLALIKGFQFMDRDKRIKGVILNQISKMYYETISQVIEDELGIDVIGYLPKLDRGTLESRYLGLKMPNEIEELENDIENAARVILDTFDMEKLFEISKVDENAAKMRVNTHDGNIDQYGQCYTDKTKMAIIPQGSTEKVRIGVARDDAFCFFYEENLKLLKNLGAELIEFSPLKDYELPKGIDGLLLGGGYPELHAKQLSENIRLREAVKKAIDSGMPSLAECGGFMYLHKEIRVDEIAYPMVGAIEGSCSKKEKLVRFGYLTIEEKSDSFIVDGNKCIKGHEFHYFDSTNNGNDAVSVKPVTGRNWEAAHITKDHWWGFAHLYYPSNIRFARAFIEKCAEWRDRNE